MSPRLQGAQPGGESRYKRPGRPARGRAGEKVTWWRLPRGVGGPPPAREGMTAPLLLLLRSRNQRREGHVRLGLRAWGGGGGGGEAGPVCAR